MKILPHSEAEEGEVFVGNVNEVTFLDARWLTKRLGKVAVSWGVVKLFPMFVQRQEMEEAGIPFEE